MCRRNTSEILHLPNNIVSHKQNRNVSIDACISHVIQHLWNNNIGTLGCCCGHNKRDPDIVIETGEGDNNLYRIATLIKEVDFGMDRKWNILQWRLQKVKENIGV
jgi:hypothetical protein